MPGSLSDFAEKELLDHICGVGSYTMPTPWLALMTTAMPETGTGGVEVANAGGSSYARKQITFGAATGTLATCSNTAIISFTNMPSCTVVGWAIYTAVTGGSLLWVGTLSASETFALGNTATINIGDLDLTLD